MSPEPPSASEIAQHDHLRRVAATVTAEDRVLEPPPPAIWDAIETVIAPDGSVAPSVLAEDPRTPPIRNHNGIVVDYWIDADDNLANVGGAWDEFALANFAPGLAAAGTAGHNEPVSLWSQMDRDEIRELWQLVVHRARSRQLPAQATFRCDGPHARRWFEMTVSPAHDGSVHFQSKLLFEEERQPVALLDPQVARDTAALPIEICNWCGRGEYHSDWLDIEQLIARARLLERDSLPPISNGICGACRDAMTAEFATGAEERQP